LELSKFTNDMHCFQKNISPEQTTTKEDTSSLELSSFDSCPGTSNDSLLEIDSDNEMQNEVLFNKIKSSEDMTELDNEVSLSDELIKMNSDAKSEEPKLNAGSHIKIILPVSKPESTDVIETVSVQSRPTNVNRIRTDEVFISSSLPEPSCSSEISTSISTNVDLPASVQDDNKDLQPTLNVSKASHLILLTSQMMSLLNLTNLLKIFQKKKKRARNIGKCFFENFCHGWRCLSKLFRAMGKCSNI